MISSIKIGEVPAWLDNAGPESDVVVSTRLRLARNLTHCRFPMRASLNERKGVYEQVTDTLRRIEQFSSYVCYSFLRLPRLEQQLLVEERIASPDLLSGDGERGVVTGDSHRVNILVNEEDHLRLHYLDSGCRTESMWDMLDSMDTLLGDKMPWAFDEQRGFLTSCPTNSGTGLRISFLLHLPGLVLTKTIDQVLQAASQMGVSTRGFFGEHSEVVGSVFQLSNLAALGASEKEFIKNTRSVIHTIIGNEREARDKILHDARLELEDKIFRAYGILLHAKTLSVDEFLNLSSALRLGIETGLFDKLTVKRLNRILLLILPAHMQTFLGRTMNDEEVNRERADVVRMLLKE
jgi:protein arginine kinase